MYQLFYPKRDTTLYEQYKTTNTGIDPILELTKIASGSPANGAVALNTYNTRILIDFGDQITTISASVSNGDIGANSKFYLNLRAIDSADIPITYSLEAYAVSQSWVNGTGNEADIPITTNGASWQYRTSDAVGTEWLTSGYANGSTGSNGVTTVGGGTWYTGSGASQSFNYETPDIRMDVTNIVREWISGSFVNNGFIIKRPISEESSADPYGSLKFFGKDTHTIYVPRLEAAWDNTNLSGTGSFAEISSDTYVLNFKNIRSEYQADERAKFRVAVRPEYPTKAYVTSSWYLTDNRLPTSSFYSIKDTVTNETIIPYDTDATRISCDLSGNYIDLRLNSFQPGRYYKFALKVERDGGNEIQIHDDGFYFKVAK
jgi:hypothetical protein